jgi:hypothetical protein
MFVTARFSDQFFLRLDMHRHFGYLWQSIQHVVFYFMRDLMSLANTEISVYHDESTLAKSFHEKAGPCQECFALSMSSSLFFPFSQAASVATLPSALLDERFSLGASWVFSIQSFRASGPRKLMKITIRRPYSWMRSFNDSTSRNSGSKASRNPALNPLAVSRRNCSVPHLRSRSRRTSPILLIPSFPAFEPNSTNCE